ncbi:hypothetical protein CgunFtcFv8_009672 [Champsocephalus gunnari]|uniref:Uncharacterized protein n=1 Tax=Champsocephalus gunnari TaxID=52237 RepID=A0AAN8C4V7_CHAGU|nr:hypothetical protein CgunFtcFv8_009672 [Champsocephalus gunnari]
MLDLFLSPFSSADASHLNILTPHISPSYPPRVPSLTELMVTDGMKESCHELIDNRQLNYHRYCQGPWLMERATVNTRKGGDWGEFENSNFDEVPFQSWS